MADDLALRLAQAIRESCIDPEVCEDDEEACFEQHVHPAWTVNGVIRHVEANVEQLAATVLAWLAGQGRLVPDGAKIREQWGVRFVGTDGRTEDVSRTSREAALTSQQRRRERIAAGLDPDLRDVLIIRAYDVATSWVVVPAGETQGAPRCPRCGGHGELHPKWAVCPPCAVAEGWEVA